MSFYPSHSCALFLLHINQRNHWHWIRVNATETKIKAFIGLFVSKFFGAMIPHHCITLTQARNIPDKQHFVLFTVDHFLSNVLWTIYAHWVHTMDEDRNCYDCIETKWYQCGWVNGTKHNINHIDTFLLCNFFLLFLSVQNVVLVSLASFFTDWNRLQQKHGLSIFLTLQINQK